jgi:hypothetical protein
MAEDNEITGELEPHDTRVVVWDVPATIECGETFRVKLGVKCSAECQTDGWTVEVRDHEGKMRATATTSGEPWPDTTGLHYVEAELTAPDGEGLHTWEARALTENLEIPHAEGVARFGVRAVPTPECLLTVVAIDRESQTPVVAAKVVLHPYKTFTDKLGVAEVRVPQGEYRLFVSGGQYFPFRAECEIKADVTIRAELLVDRELSDADIWS